MRVFRNLALTILFVCGAAAQTQADTLADGGRAVLKANQGAVITIELVLKQQFSFSGSASQENESKSEATGTVIAPNGLTVLSLSETDPSNIFEIMMAGSGRNNVTMSTEVREATMLLADGAEIQAEVILRDKDLDMAFLRPTEKQDRVFDYVDFAGASAVDYLDPVIALNRLGRVARRAHTASIERIEAVVDKPRTFYVPGKDPTNTGLGSPAFTLDGQPVGVFFLRAIKASSTGGLASMFGGSGQNVITVLLPGADIVEAVDQVPPYKN